ncbi:DUF4124 domain-containing protein [Variovorax fucosicus]|uniref:DUF4124 domain-containing protein n=1 Tax=Variovorax fucosicus TaxID=3053517 RepID=UPI002578C9E8|nr:DUF4124 domain-containing protein [Variovorax sp. J22G47]MDM0058991.1 DUF4124 domain-containing protein [Variovorax sp. J22G47]
MKYLHAALFLIPVVCKAAPPVVYRCEIQGKVNYSDVPCVGAKTVDVTPTQGADKMSGRSSKGKEVQREEFHITLDNATRPLHGLSHGEMDVRRRRYQLSPADQRQCASLDQQIPELEARATKTTGSARGQADVALYQARKRVFDLKC